VTRLTAAHSAGILVILAAAFWWHAWMPAVAVLAFVGWVLIHRRYQGVRREAFMRFRRRIWPAPRLVLIALIIASLAVYLTATVAVEARVLPIALNLVAMGLIVLGSWRRVPES